MTKQYLVRYSIEDEVEEIVKENIIAVNAIVGDTAQETMSNITTAIEFSLQLVDEVYILN